MSAVILQVGQCGNQLGLDWCELLTKSCAKKDGNWYCDRYFYSAQFEYVLPAEHFAAFSSPFGTREGRLALVCVDSEPKVLNRARQLVRSEKLLESNVVQGKGGRGGNWAYGYHGNSGEESNGLLQQAMEALRKEAERRSYYGGTVLLHSLSGGTGSGLGSRLCEEIRAEFPAGHILTASVVPHRSGESPLQHYNSLLGLAALHRSADGMLLFHNDQSLSSSGVPAPGRSGFCNGLPQGSLSPMNVHIASCMAGLLLPVRSLTPSSGLSLGAEPWELIRSLCPMPAAKLLHTTQACSSEKLTWDRLASITLQAVPKLSPAGKPQPGGACCSSGGWRELFHCLQCASKAQTWPSLCSLEPLSH
ncbi:tubulin delta chain-like isoform X3 [Denticeps clupeoides]|uniref:tubulin delta chain-like isoform X3 n=1 Tax=Denticeps clupeoides TaxID=299321 RepID=UPI0010A335D6|nr:tubulin delta chain-like isoform X3 [Denticeps clupeoides]